MCGLCHEAMDFFRGKEIAFESFEVFWKDGELVDDDNGRELKRRIGDVEFVPQVFIDGKSIGGWKNISKLIETGEIEEILAKS